MGAASLDKLSLLVDGVIMDAMQDWIRRDAPVIRHYDRSGPYRWGYELADGVWAEHRDTKSQAPSDLRVEFNPNHVTEADEVALTSLLGFGDFARVSRVDVAIDYFNGANLGALGWHQKGARVGEMHYAGDEVSGRYIGSARSRLRFLVYDKGLQERLGVDWWRVEARHRPGRTPDALPRDLFDGLECYGIPDGNWEQQAQAIGLIYAPWLWLKIGDKRKRKALRDQMARAGRREVVPPAEVYQEHREALQTLLAQWQGRTRDVLKSAD